MDSNTMLWELLQKIREYHLEMDMYKLLHEWLINDHKRITTQYAEAKADLRIIGKLMKSGNNKQVLEGIKAVVDRED